MVMMKISSDSSWLVPDWKIPAGVRCLTTTRCGGVSQEPFAGLNLGDHVGDDPLAVASNRARVVSRVGSMPVWLEQVHGTRVVDIDALSPGAALQADAALSRRIGGVCTVMTADCLPVLFCDIEGRVVAAAHAGWRGLLEGVLENTVTAMRVPADTVLAWLGPAIGPQAFEVGDEVRSAFVAENASAEMAFCPNDRGRWLADIFLLARQRLIGCGVRHISGGQWCTVSDPSRFFSYRRDGQTGRMATMIWRES